MNFTTKRRATLALTAAAGATAASLLGGAAARAQDGDAAPRRPEKPLSIRLGGHIISNGEERRALGYSIPTFGIAYDIRRTASDTPNVYEVYFDYFKRPKTRGGTRLEAEMFGVGLADRIYLTPRGQRLSSYVGAGVGFYQIRTTLQETGFRATEVKTAIGAKFLAGTELQGGFFGEIEYNFLPEPELAGNRIRLSGTQFRLGYRF